MRKKVFAAGKKYFSFLFVLCFLFVFTAQATPITTANHEVYIFGFLEAPITTASHEAYFFVTSGGPNYNSES